MVLTLSLQRWPHKTHLQLRFLLENVPRNTSRQPLHHSDVKFMRTSARMYLQHLEAPQGAVKKRSYVMNEAGGPAGSEGW